MLNYIWAAMLIIGILFGAVNGNMKEITEAALDSAGEAVSLCIAMAGIMAFWVGLMEIAEQSGLISRLTNKLSPFVSFLFPNLPKGHKARDFISLNFIAIILGLGWAATPAGLSAMQELAKLEEERFKETEVSSQKKSMHLKGVASNEMCIFLIINISSLQLIPVNIIAYRQQYGSVNPARIIAPAIAATMISTLAAIVFCKVMSKRKDR